MPNVKPAVENLSTAALCKRMQRSTTFDYNDEAVELTRRLKAEGKAWRWSDDPDHPKVVIYWAHPVFGPNRPMAARAALRELRDAQENLTGWSDYDTPKMVDRYRKAREDRAHYREYGDSMVDAPL